MNYTINDRGEAVPAVGAPGSVGRAKCERPSLLAAIGVVQQEEKDHGHLPEESHAVVATMLHKAGILSGLEPDSVLTAAGFDPARRKEILGQLDLIRRDSDRRLMGATLPFAREPEGPAPSLSPGV